MRVTFFQRLPQGANFSVERLFMDVRHALPEGIDAKVAVSRFESRGFFRRIYNIIEAVFRQGDVNHITGDVHFLTFLLRKRRTLLTILDLDQVDRRKGLRWALLLFLWYWLPIKRAAIVSVISQATKDDLLRHIKVDSRKIRVIHCAVSEVFRPTYQRFNVAKPNILQIGNKPNKNLERLVEALKNIQCHLRIVGKLSDAQIANLRQSRVEFSVVYNISDDELIEEYRRCDILAFASTFEGFGLPIVEAQAMGRPVVTSTVGPMPEVAGDAACLVDPFDVMSIRQGILKVINDFGYRERLIQQGFKNIERFRPKKIAQQYVTIYRELLSC